MNVLFGLFIYFFKFSNIALWLLEGNECVFHCHFLADDFEKLSFKVGLKVLTRIYVERKQTAAHIMIMSYICLYSAVTPRSRVKIGANLINCNPNTKCVGSNFLN